MTRIDQNTGDDAELVARIAPALRAPETLDPSFEARVMAALEDEAAHGRARGAAQGWWRRRYTIEVSPLAGLALAAGLAIAAFTGAYALQHAGQRGIQAPVLATEAAPPRDTVHVVRFVFVDRAARSVALVGDFNRWTKNATVLEPMGTAGAWSVSITLPPGRHEYAFVVDGERWMSDPFAATVHDEHGTESSVVRVGA
jgi:hypothetical protein